MTDKADMTHVMDVTAEQAAIKLEADLVERVLIKLGFSKAPSLDLNGLSELYGAWCRRVPFDNIRKLIHVNANNPGPMPGELPDEFFEQWLKHGTGGTCWPGNGALHALLAALGFNAVRGVATMLAAPNIPPNHGTVIVEYDTKTYLVDASILHNQPLLLEEGKDCAVDHPAWGIHATKSDGKWMIRWRPLMRQENGLDCRLEYFPTTQADFRARYEVSRPWSPFNYELNARLNREDAVVGVGYGVQAKRAIDGIIVSSAINHRQRVEFLINEIGISEEMAARLPEDRPTPPPPGSHTAARQSQTS